MFECVRDWDQRHKRAQPNGGRAVNVEVKKVYSCPEVLGERIVKMASVYPDFPAVCSDDATLTFGALLKQSLSLAHVLQARIGDAGEAVAILGQRRVETPLAMVACLLAGVPFLVIDASYPLRRVIDLWQLSNCAALLYCEQGATADLPALAGEIDPERLIAIDHAWPPNDDVPRPFHNETAYFLMTSGTTGQPKRVRVGEAPLVHSSTGMSRHFMWSRDPASRCFQA